jgi:hypothetical protein
MKSATIIIASMLPVMRHTRSVVPAKDTRIKIHSSLSQLLPNASVLMNV